MNKNFTKFEVKVDKESIEKINPEFAKVKVYVMYHGDNRNYTSMSKETIEEALYSLKGIPVVGEWKEENNNFGSHGGKLEISDEGIELKDTTKPYGFVPFEIEPQWEEILEKDGITKHEYLTCEAYLWYGRYAEIEKILNDGSNQSMEIVVEDSDMREDGYLDIKKFHFSSLCILGKDTDSNKNVEPCFESASINRFSLDEFKNEFDEMIKEFKKTFSKEEGEEEMKNETKETVEKIVKKKEVEEETQTEENKETIENTQKETQIEEKDELQDNENNTEDEKEDFKKEYQDLVKSFKTLEDTVKELEDKVETLTTENNSLKENNKKLNEFKLEKETEERKNQVKEITSKFDFSNEEISDLVGQAEKNEISLENFEEKLYAMTGKKLKEKYSAILEHKEDDSEILTTQIFSKTDTKDSYPYPSLKEYFDE